MGISILTAMEIQTNETEIVPQGPYDNDKYGMAILMVRDGEVHKKMLSVDYGYYESEEKAIKGGENLVKEIREMGDKIFEEEEEEEEEVREAPK